VARTRDAARHRHGDKTKKQRHMEPLLIMTLVLFEVALWQWRVAITLRGSLLGGALLGLIGAVVQVTAISRVVQDMGDIAKVAGYACGVAIGVLVGCLIDRRLSVRQVSVRVFAPADPDLVPALRTEGWPVTATRGQGHSGQLEILYVAIDERRTAKLEQALHLLAPDASWTVERLAGSHKLLPASS
jgi:uncharacterized protein YebE (UPF0316 family)